MSGAPDDFADDIVSLLNETHPNTMKQCKRKVQRIIKRDTFETINDDIKNLLGSNKCAMGSAEYAGLNKMLALCNLKAGKETEGIYHLVESHAVILRQQVLHRHIKTEKRAAVLNLPQMHGLNSENVKFNMNNNTNIDMLSSKLSELPEEWYVLQVTAQWEPLKNIKYLKSPYDTMHALHLSVLPTGNLVAEPFCITLPKPETYNNYDVCSEMQKILFTNKSDLEATYINSASYWKMRGKQNNKMKVAVEALEYTWLREWRILFMADPIEKLELVKDVTDMIDKLISDSCISKELSSRAVKLLKKVALGACYLSREEIARAVIYILSKYEKLANNIILSIYGKLGSLDTLQTARRKNLILIIDENMDYIPFEHMDILHRHPVTRFPSLHIAYALFKEHEPTIQGGCKILKASDIIGTHIVNPSGNLSNMEKRLRLFIEYWLPHWKGRYNVEPEPDTFEDALVNHNILMYNGHGSGIQYLPAERIEKLRVRANVLLFGCNSVKLLFVGGRFPPYGVSNQYLIASSPCVLGMLWEVTDADIDKMTADFISNWIPSAADRPWSEVDVDAWSTGSLKFSKSEKERAPKTTREPEMLRAAANSKGVCLQYMTAAAIVMRGLPVRLT